MSWTYGILLFDQVEELDFVGPLNVFSYATWAREGHRVVTIADSSRVPIVCGNGLLVIADFSFDDAPALDLLLVPGGRGVSAAIDNPQLLNYLRRAARSCRWITSVCTGAVILQRAGLADGRKLTTHRGAIDQLKQAGAAHVVEAVRYVVDGNVVSSAGVSAGIDMALWLVGQICSVEEARAVQEALQYEPAPPYSRVA